MIKDHQLWRGGDRVEVERLVSGVTIYIPATVVNAPSEKRKLVWVEHEALTAGCSVRKNEYVTPTHLHPSPPRDELNQWFKAGDEVDVFSDNEGFWVRGNVTTVLEDLRYIVEFKGGNRPQVEVTHFNLRLHREWEDGAWVPSVLQPSNNLESTPKSVKLKIKDRRRDEYENGAHVEVRSEEEAYKGSWYSARILCLLGHEKYIVEHLKFSRDDGEPIPLRDVVESQSMRPVPPRELSSVMRYELGDEVHALFNKRWWSGKISKVLESGSKYLVYFFSMDEERIVLDINLRLHKDWIDGQWITLSKENCYKPILKKPKPCERTEKVFNNGMMVEVQSNEQGYEGSWFSAKIIDYLGENRYTIEYQTLKTDDEEELLKEEANGSDIRPIPPPMIPKSYRYELNENVDAWYNEGWWSGRVCKINNDYTRYSVYFKTSDERLEFAYKDLRPCQVWRNGKWTCA